MEDVRRLDGPATREISAELARLYEDCYSRPPWSETPAQFSAYPGQLDGSTRRPGFAAWVVRDGGRLAGACYGWPTPPDLSGSPVYSTLVRAAGADRAAMMTRNAFELAELFVHPGHQNRGLGRTLLSMAVDGWETAWLITHPEAPAARLYRRLGWRRNVELPADFYPRLPMAVYTLGPPGGSRPNPTGLDRRTR